MPVADLPSPNRAAADLVSAAGFGIPRAVIAVIAVLSAVSCTSIPESPGVASRPDWILHPKDTDGYYFYKVGSASGCPTEEAARDAAYKNALASLAKETFAEVKVDIGGPSLASGFAIQSAESMPECQYHEKGIYGTSCWLQVRWPATERAKLLEQVRWCATLEQRWRDTQTLIAQHRWQDAGVLLNAIISDYRKAYPPSFSTSQVQLILGDVSRQQGNRLEAWRCYQAVLKMATDPALRKEARDRIDALGSLPLMLPLKDRWGAAKLGILCGIRDGRECRAFPALTRELCNFSLEAEIETVNLAEDIAPARLAAAIDGKPDDLAAICETARAKNKAGILLIVLYDIDPAKRGKVLEMDGQRVPLPDTLVKFLVAVPGTAKSLFAGDFKELAGDSSESAFAKPAAVILLRNYLVPKCPPVEKAAPP